jgi:hemerythrin
MTRNPNIAVITIGYKHYALEDAQSALELMALMSKAVQVEERVHGMSDYTPCTHFLDEEPTMPELKFVPVNKFNPHETVTEVRERVKREKADREDMEQQFREAPAALPAPDAPVVDDLADVDFL